MKNRVRHIIPLIVCVACLTIDNPLFSQTKGYRKPSESDVQWLLGSSTSKPASRKSCDEIVQVAYRTPAACQPVCGKLRNPACACDQCSQHVTDAPLPPDVEEVAVTAPTKKAVLETGALAADTIGQPEPPTIVQTADERLAKTPKPEDFETVDIETKIAAPTTRAVASDAQPLPKKNVASESPVRQQPPKATPDLRVAHADPVRPEVPSNHRPSNCRKPCEPKGISCTSSFGVSDDCSCDHCRGHVDEIVAETLIGDFFRKMTRLNKARKCHGTRCNCWLCTELDMPDMVGDAAWVPGRFLRYTVPNPNNSDYVYEVSAPTMLLSRLNVAERFNAEARDRIWVDYRHFNNAAGQFVDGTGVNRQRQGMAVDQFTFGFEKLLTSCSSLEVRVPLLNQFDSSQRVNRSGDSAAEIGNVSLNYKYVFTRSSDFTFAGGIGVTFPTAEDWKLGGTDVRLKNKAYYLIPYLGVQWHPNDSTFGHLLVQFDVPLSGNELRAGARNVDVDEATLLRLGLQVGRWFYRNERGMHSCRLGGFFELDYTVATDKADATTIVRQNDRWMIASKKNRPQPLNLIVGVPVMFGRLSITNAVILPVTSNDRQFSVAYNFSVSRYF